MITKIFETTPINGLKAKMIELKNFQVKAVPETCFYVPEFIAPGEEKLLIHNIVKTSQFRWTQLKNRR